jgi:hypothetical protein
MCSTKSASEADAIPHSPMRYAKPIAYFHVASVHVVKEVSAHRSDVAVGMNHREYLFFGCHFANENSRVLQAVRVRNAVSQPTQHARVVDVAYNVCRVALLHSS